MRRFFVFLHTLLLGFAVIAAGPAAAEGQRVPASKPIVDQKRLLVENMAYRSVAAKAIIESGDSEAKAALDKAKGLVEEAKTAAAAGNYQDADGKLNQALKLINDHAKRLTHKKVGAERDQELFKRRRHAVETFLNAYQRVSSDPNADSSKMPKEHTDWIAQELAKADALAGKGDFKKAQEPLAAAYERTRELIRTMRAGQTLTRSLNFATAEEEYQYELKRNDSHFALLDFAISEKNPRGSVVQFIDRSRGKARDERGTAEGMAKQGDFKGAIGKLNASTNVLLQAIRMSGIYVPG